MATIRKRGNLQWEARIRRKGYPTTCKTFDTKTEAEAWAKDVETNMNKNLFVSSKEAESYTLTECLDRYIEEYVPRLKHPEVEIRRIRFLQKHPLACRVMATIRSKDISEYRKDREQGGASPNTIRLDFALLSRLFNYARSDWGMESLSNPIELVTKPKVGKGRERRLEDGEEEKLMGCASLGLRPVIQFALATGMRREEIASLSWKNVNLDKRYALLVDTKNGETRTVPLSVKALDVLNGLSSRSSQDNVFGMTSGAITQAMRKACQDAGIENFKFHDLRHEAVSRLFEDTDLDVMEIRAITGHRTLQMLARYTHLRTSRLVDRLSGVKRNSSKP
jgi:Site-specific recombinase XerD